MRNGQQHHHNHNKRMRGRNNQQHNRRNQNPLTRVYESNGPDVKIRGTANHVADKYLQLARDAQSSGDPVSAENYFQHAEHYFRLIAAAQDQFRQQNPNFQSRPEGGNDQQFQPRSDEFEEGGGDEDGQPFGQQPFGTGEQPYLPQNAQPFVQRDNNYQPREQRDNQQPPRAPQPEPGNEGGLPAFITGGAPPPPQPPQPQGQNGYENGGSQPDRFPLHRRRRRHRGPRDNVPGQGRDRPEDNG